MRYNQVIQETNNEELLLNLVRLRYGEGVSFLPITAVNAQFELDAGAQVVGGVSEAKRHLLGTGRLDFADRPTLSFDPRRSQELTKALLTRFELETSELLDAAGWDTGRLLRLLIEANNGVGNALGGGGPTPEHAPDYSAFQQLASHMQRLKEARQAVLSVERREADVPSTVPFASVDAQAVVGIKKAGCGVRSAGDKGGYILSENKIVWGVRVHPGAWGSPELLETMRILRLKPGEPFYEFELAASGQIRPIDVLGLLT